MNPINDALLLHRECRGKIETGLRIELSGPSVLESACFSGVTQPCLEIHANPSKSFELTRRWNQVIVASNGSSVLNLGNIGPAASLPAIEGTCLLLKKLANIDTIPLCINSSVPSELIHTLSLLAPSCSAILLEGVSFKDAPSLSEDLHASSGLPVFQISQDGNSVAVLAALYNSLKLVGKKLDSVRIVLAGAGVSGSALAKLLLAAGAADLTICDSRGALYPERHSGMNTIKRKLAKQTNLEDRRGRVTELIAGADIFIGLSIPNLLTSRHIRSMNRHPIVFSLATPTPEIFPEEAERGGAIIVASSRGHLINPIEPTLGLIPLIRGALDAGASCVTDKMRLAAASALSNSIPGPLLKRNHLLPNLFDSEILNIASRAVVEQARSEGVSRLPRE